MAIADLFNKTVTVRRREIKAPSDEFGHPREDWETVGTVSCALQPKTGDTQRLEAGQIVSSTHMLYCAIGEDIQEDDRVLDGDREYRVVFVGDDAGRGHHLKIELTLVKGTAD
jgi:head-tail adaptor